MRDGLSGILRRKKGGNDGLKGNQRAGK